MNIQSLSICVPAPKCVNHCEFCVSRMHKDEYENKIMIHPEFESNYLDQYETDYLKRLEYTRDNGCNTVMLTGQVEPQQNKQFLIKFSELNKRLPSPFKNIEMQTTGTLIDNDYLFFLKNTVGVNTISLSISSFDNEKNNSIINTPPNGKIILGNLCSNIKLYDFNLRLSLNMTSELMGDEEPDITDILSKCKELGADQVTFRKMYSSTANTPQDKWIDEHHIPKGWFVDLKTYIKSFGNYIDTLEYGNDRYSVDGISIVVDEDCMAKSKYRQSLKYVILRPNCKLYSKWDDKGSLIF